MKDIVAYAYGDFDETDFNEIADKLRTNEPIVNITRSQLIYLMKYLNRNDHYDFCGHCGKYRFYETKCRCEDNE